MPKITENAYVVDDTRDSAEVISEQLKDAGITPVILTCSFATVDSLFALLPIGTDNMGVVCDHRLSPGGCATFTGASAVAALYDKHVPALLVTTFPMDLDVSIREWRAKLPVVLDREAVDPDTLLAGFEKCWKEITEGPPPSRRIYPSVVRIEEITDESNYRVADAIIPNWNARVGVRFPLTLLPERLRNTLQRGDRLLADVNIGAVSADDLFLQNFRAAPSPYAG